MVVGVRPHYVKAAALRASLELRGLDVRVIDTRQHYDVLLNDRVISDLALRVDSAAEVEPGQGPLHYLSRGVDAVARALGNVPSRRCAVLVFGDANPAVVGAVAANAMAIPLIHVEAGARRNPIEREHWNSKLVDTIATLRFAITPRHLEELIREGLEAGSLLTGDLAFDWYRTRWRPLKSDQRSGVIITLHRPDNMRLEVLDACVLGCIHCGLPVGIVLHPRNRALVEAAAWRDRVEVLQPQSPSEILERVGRSSALLTDSGGLAREAHYLKTPVLMRRDVGGWPELLQFGVLRRVESTIAGVADGLSWASRVLSDYPIGSPLVVENGLEMAVDRIMQEFFDE